jgi:hypothetical protein
MSSMSSSAVRIHSSIKLEPERIWPSGLIIELPPRKITVSGASPNDVRTDYRRAVVATYDILRQIGL